MLYLLRHIHNHLDILELFFRPMCSFLVHYHLVYLLVLYFFLDYINANPASETTLWFNGQNNAQNGTYNYDKNIKSKTIDEVIVRKRMTLRNKQ